MFSRLSVRVWKASTRSSNNTKFSPVKSPYDPTDMSIQGSEDVQDRFGDLVSWLSKLEASVAAANARGTREESERRRELARFGLHLCSRVFLTQPNPP